MTDKHIVHRLAAFLSDYMAFPDPAYAPVLALWALGTWVYKEFDAFPYLTITAATKQAGKTRLAELLGMIACNAQPTASMTPAAMYRLIADSTDGLTLVIDEAEGLSSEASPLRAVLNIGYRYGQTIKRVTDRGVQSYDVYCPKVFVLIGDVFDTLRDRSIVITLRRGVPAKQFRFADANREAAVLRRDMEEWRDANKGKWNPVYPSHLDGREAELWAPLMTIAQGICSQSEQQMLVRASVDIYAEKTADARKYTALAQAEDKLRDEQFGTRAVRDLLLLATGDDKALYSDEAVERLKGIDTAPWRRYRGEGLTVYTLASLVRPFGLSAKLIRRGRDVRRGYSAADIRKAASHL